MQLDTAHPPSLSADAADAAGTVPAASGHGPGPRAHQSAREAARNHADLIGTDPRVFLLKLLLWASLLALGFWLMAQPATAAAFAGVVLAGLMMAHGIELQHQALHGTGFGRRGLDRAAGVLLGLPLLISYSDYRRQHLHHHRHVGTPYDEEFFAFAKQGGQHGWRALAVLFMAPHWRGAASRLLRAWAPASGRAAHRASAPDARREHQLFGLLVAAAGIAIAAGVWPRWPLALTALLLASAVHTLVEWPEHAGCEAVADPWRNTRTIRSNRWMTWFTNGNNYHVEHHLLPSVPPERLARLHRRVAGRIRFQNDSYRAFVGAALRQMHRSAMQKEVA